MLRPHSSRPSRLRLAAATGVAALALAAAPAMADLFRVDIAGSSDSLTVSGNSLFDLARNVAGQEEEFSIFSGQSFTASVDYAGLNDAMVLTSNSDNSIVTLQITSTGFRKTLNTAEGVSEDQIGEFRRRE